MCVHVGMCVYVGVRTLWLTCACSLVFISCCVYIEVFEGSREVEVC